MMREIIFDLETTGLDPTKDDIIELAFVELFDKVPTGNYVHHYVKTKQIITNSDIHGITNNFLSDKPYIEEVLDEVLEFISDNCNLIAHNSDFDMGFLNVICNKLNKTRIPNPIIDTLKLARKKYPKAQSNSLDNLCKRFNINIEHRQEHGALKDSFLLCKVYYYLSLQDEINIFDIVQNENVEPKYGKHYPFPWRIHRVK